MLLANMVEELARVLLISLLSFPDSTIFIDILHIMIYKNVPN